MRRRVAEEEARYQAEMKAEANARDEAAARRERDAADEEAHRQSKRREVGVHMFRWAPPALLPPKCMPTVVYHRKRNAERRKGGVSMRRTRRTWARSTKHSATRQEQPGRKRVRKTGGQTGRGRKRRGKRKEKPDEERRSESESESGSGRGSGRRKERGQAPSRVHPLRTRNQGQQDQQELHERRLPHLALGLFLVDHLRWILKRSRRQMNRSNTPKFHGCQRGHCACFETWESNVRRQKMNKHARSAVLWCVRAPSSPHACSSTPVPP